MTMAGPLPGLRQSTPRQAGIAGVFAGKVERLNPLAVSVPALTGLGQLHPNVAQVPGLTLVVGDDVWVACLDGDREQRIVIAGGIPPALSGTTRPSAAVVGVGAPFYDITLGKPIWSDGAVWNDATGAPV